MAPSISKQIFREHGAGGFAIQQSQALYAIPRGQAPRLAWTITVVCLGGFAVLAVVNVFAEQSNPDWLAVCLVSVAIVFALQFYHCSSRLWARSTSHRAWTLGAQALFTYLPMTFFGVAWGGMAGCLAASVLLAVTGWASWLLFGMIGLSMLVFPPMLSATAVQTIHVAVSTVLVGVVLYGLARLADLVQEMHAARAELAWLAVAEERLRFARDLHDLLGYSLSVITLKSELVNRFLTTRPEHVREEVGSILQISRQALADVRTVASGYRDLSLLDEVASATTILRALDIEVQVNTDAAHLGTFPSTVDTVLATALREGVTNLLRHSEVRHCSISVVASAGVVRLTLTNDGMSERADCGKQAGGSGLGNIGARLAAINGVLEVGVRHDGRFHLVASAPIDPVGGDLPTAGARGEYGF